MSACSRWTRLLLVTAAAVSVCLFSLPALAQEGYNIVEIRTATQDQVQQVADMGIDILRVAPDVVIAHVSPADRKALEAAGLPFKVLVQDVEKHIREMEAAEAIPEAQYHTYATLNADLYALESSGIAKVQSIGTSIEGRDILAVKISDNPELEEPGEAQVLFVGCHHAREWISVEVAYYIALHLVDNYGVDPEVTSLVDNGEIWVVPMVNPDGHQYTVDTYRLWRKNRRNNGGSYGVDLNRNYAEGWGGPGSSSVPSSDTYRGTAPFSEPETQALRDFFLAHDFKAMITYHSYAQLILYPWGNTNVRAPDHYKLDIIAGEMESLVNAVHGMTYTAEKSSALYLASGTTDDWTYAETGIPSFTIELRPINDFVGFQLPASEINDTSEENIPAAMYLLGLTQQDQDGDGVVEVDDNCMGASNPGQQDADGDHVGPPCDCNDFNAAVSPGEVEICTNGIDDDCDGLVDGDDPDCGSSGYAAAANAQASVFGPSSVTGSGAINELALLVLPLGAVLVWRVVRRRRR
jgi:carboxypeptidase T